MSTPRLDRARELVDHLNANGVKATADPAAVLANAPCVLVPPPALVLRRGAVASWRLVAVASTPNALDAWGQLDQLVDRVHELLPVEAADPTSWAPAQGVDPLPAYVLTMSDNI